jgi:hypothetical protein
VGKTPLDLEMNPTTRAVKFRLELAGRRPEPVSFTGDQDVDAKVRLSPRRSSSGGQPSPGPELVNPFGAAK